MKNIEVGFGASKTNFQELVLICFTVKSMPILSQSTRQRSMTVPVPRPSRIALCYETENSV